MTGVILVSANIKSPLIALDAFTHGRSLTLQRVDGSNMIETSPSLLLGRTSFTKNSLVLGTSLGGSVWNARITPTRK